MDPRFCGDDNTFAMSDQSTPAMDALRLREQGLRWLRERRATEGVPCLLRATATPPALCVAGLTLDITRQRLSPTDLAALYQLGAALDIIGAHRAMMRGAIVNIGEQRAALHSALRAPVGDADAPADIIASVHAELARMRTFANAVRGGQWRGATGQAITDVVNIGIGGSDSGPRLAVAALSDVPAPGDASAAGPRVHFLSNVDGHAVARLLPRLDAARTLAVVSSKSFSTRETLLNAAALRAWQRDHGIDDAALSRHMVCVSARSDAAAQLGLPANNQFRLWDWVGGRFSVWSAVGLPVMLAIGPQRFDEFLAGAHAMDRHSLQAPLPSNLPATLALWKTRVLDTTSLCLLPYDERLAPMVTWLQQLQMESLGKSVSATGAPLDFAAGEVVWGGVGTDVQHTFFQALRQGTLATAVDIVYANGPDHAYAEHHRALLANARAQAEALVADDPASRAVNSVSVLELDALTPATLGALMALYEHKTTMLATLLGINAFDQPGVELGKQLARELEAR